MKTKDISNDQPMVRYGPKINFTNKEMSYLKEKNAWEWNTVSYTNMGSHDLKTKDGKNGYQFLRDGELNDYLNFLKRSNY